MWSIKIAAAPTTLVEVAAFSYNALGTSFEKVRVGLGPQEEKRSFANAQDDRVRGGMTGWRRGAGHRRTCPPPDRGRGRGPTTASLSVAKTMLALGGAGVSEANGVPPVAGLLGGFNRPFGSAQGPEMALRGRGWPFGSAQGPGMAILGQRNNIRGLGWCAGIAGGINDSFSNREMVEFREIIDIKTVDFSKDENMWCLIPMFSRQASVKFCF